MRPKINNFFLTGKINIGKTTVLNRVLKDHRFYNLKIKGYRTKPLVENGVVRGYIFQIINGEKKHFAHVNLLSSEKFDRYKIDPFVFNDLGIMALKDAIINADIIVMDEIGVMEKKAQKFINIILHCLDSEKLVLGVYQQRAHWFVELIQNRDDILIFEIFKNNRDIIHREIIKKICNNIKIALTNLK